MVTAQLSPERRRHAESITAWLLGDARNTKDPNDVLTELCERVGAAGVPVDRATSAIQVLHSETLGVARVWERGQGTRTFTLDYTRDARDELAVSPFRAVHERGGWIDLWLPDTPDDAFTVVPDLKADGFRHYVCVPVKFMNGMENAFSFVTKSPDGFSREDLDLIRVLMPAMGALMEILAVHRILNEVVRLYAGDEPRRRILSGDVHRGEVTRIDSAILFADMRGFTSLSMELEAEQVTDLLNRYYDCVAPHVEAHGGEVLKFIGDGILAIFRAEPDEASACARALQAARASLEAVDALGDGDGEVPKFDIGIGLHLGEAAYGNVGSGQRLDFTVIGRDVNIASRIDGLSSTLGERLLVSERFAEAVGRASFRDLGEFELKGLSRPSRVFCVDA